MRVFYSYYSHRMQFIDSIWQIILESLFPLSKEERELLSWTPQQAREKLPAAPEPQLERCRSIFAYKDERVRKLIWNIKYKKSAYATSIGGYALYHSLPRRAMASPLLSPVIIIPMPITVRRRRERGFNQCELLADEMKRLDAGNRLTLEKNLLIRVQHAARQTLKTRDERLESAQGIFALNETVSISKDATIIVIDDVITTGSTMKSALEILHAGGFEKVSGLSLAH